jgi:hypothetical protein
MTEDTKTTPVEAVSTEQEVKTATSEAKIEITPELQKVIDGAVEGRLKREAEKRERELAELQAKHIAELEERERLSKLSDEQRQAELQKKYESELSAKEVRLNLTENKLEFARKFEEDGLPVKMLDFIVDADKQVMTERYEAFKTSWNSEVNRKLEEKLKPTTSLPNFQSNSPKATLKEVY